MRDKQIEAYSKYMENNDGAEFRSRRNEVNHGHYRKRKDKQQA